MKTLAQQIAQEWEQYPVAAQVIGSLPDDTDETEINDLAKLLDDSYEFARECAQDLAKYDLVTYIKGSRGWQSRIKWNYPPRAIADLLLGKTDHVIQLIGSSSKGMNTKANEYLGKKTWSISEVVTLISNSTGVDRESVVIDIKIPEIKALLARSQGISVDDVSVRIG